MCVACASSPPTAHQSSRELICVKTLHRGTHSSVVCRRLFLCGVFELAENTTAAFHTIRYDFRPTSIDTSRNGELTVRGDIQLHARSSCSTCKPFLLPLFVLGMPYSILFTCRVLVSVAFVACVPFIHLTSVFLRVFLEIYSAGQRPGQQEKCGDAEPPRARR
jgi:hypothetical protein